MLSFHRNTKILNPKWDGSGKKIPFVIEQYNKNILGVDKMNQLNRFKEVNVRVCKGRIRAYTGILYEQCVHFT